MRRNTKGTHEGYLERLIISLPQIGESPLRIKWIMKDGIWLKENSTERISLCDLICVYYDNTGVPIELKGDKCHRTTAIRQLEQGANFILNELKLECNYGRFVTYSGRGYRSEMIFFQVRPNGKEEVNPNI